MATTITLTAAEATTALTLAYPGEVPMASQEKFFTQFADFCIDSGGKPMKNFPAPFNAMPTPDSPETEWISYAVHVARFPQPRQLDAFVAAIFKSDTGEYAFVHNEDREHWPRWLTKIVALEADKEQFLTTTSQ